MIVFFTLVIKFIIPSVVDLRSKEASASLRGGFFNNWVKDDLFS